MGAVPPDAAGGGARMTRRVAPGHRVVRRDARSPGDDDGRVGHP